MLESNPSASLRTGSERRPGDDAAGQGHHGSALSVWRGSIVPKALNSLADWLDQLAVGINYSPPLNPYPPT